MEVCPEVLVDISAHPVDKPFHYLLPQNQQVELGHRVLVPFGPRQVEGYVIGFSQPDPNIKLKGIIRTLDETPLISQEVLELSHWMAQEYNCLLVEALSFALPPGIKLKNKRVNAKSLDTYTLINDDWQNENLGHKQLLALQQLADAPGLQLSATVLSKLGIPYTSLKSLMKRGFIHKEQVGVFRRPQGQSLNDEHHLALKLTWEQEKALDEINKGQGVFLLHGVTGSGKTEVYLQALAQVLEKGQGALVLVPEIALTTQTLGRFQARFGDQVALLHSNLSIGERYDEWRRVHQGKARIVVGARSAVFAPVANLGLIILDEEHEPSFKQDDRHPRYHARAVAIKRGEIAGAKVLLGSATPALESYYKSLQGEYTLLTLPKRINDLPLPPVEIVDMRKELKAGNRSIFSVSLQNALATCLAAKHQAILFLNRRGYTTFVLCRECGEVLHCGSCAVSLTYHQTDNLLRCHYCGLEKTPPKICPHCQSSAIRHFGAGTQKVVEALGQIFPQVRISRLDGDVTGRKGAHASILKSFQAGQTDILVGTQMVAKGLDFPRVMVVGILAADTILNLPDFRSCERTFQLLVQSAGRCGRSQLGSKVVIQTYNPHNYAIQAAAQHDYLHFWEKEIEFRQNLKFPPFCKLVRLLLQGEEEGDVIRGAELLGRLLRPKTKEIGWQMLGPAPAPLSKLHNKYRWHILLKVPLDDKLPLKDMLHDFVASCLGAKISLAVDVEPLSML